MEFTVRIEWYTALPVVFGLACFGWAYNRWVARQIREGYDRGYMSFIVSIGCAVTGAGFALMFGSWILGLGLFGCFLASGTPMIVGDVQRYVEARRREEVQARAEAEGSLPQ